jgi:hypothetical protein
VGNDFRNILTCFTEVMHKCMYDTSQVLYSVHEFLDNFEMAQEHFRDREMRFEKERGIFKGKKNLREKPLKALSRTWSKIIIKKSISSSEVLN